MKILVIGGTGMLGRPVVRRLLKDGFSVRVLVRSIEKARKILPPSAEIVAGDLENVSSLESAVRGCDAVYVSVETFPGSSFKPETDGLRNVVVAAKKAGNPRLLVLSALGSSDLRGAAHPWWHIRVKHEAQSIARGSGLPWTIFEPVWFMESIPLFIRGKSFTWFSGAKLSSYWISADDYGRIVSASLAKNIGMGEIVPVMGKEILPIEDAAARFIAAYDSTIKQKRAPFFILRLAGFVNAKAKELYTLLGLYGQWQEPPPDPAVWERFARPEMDLAAYARYVKDNGDFPQKN